jgi:hypothetical protein
VGPQIYRAERDEALYVSNACGGGRPGQVAGRLDRRLYANTISVERLKESFRIQISMRLARLANPEVNHRGRSGVQQILFVARCTSHRLRRVRTVARPPTDRYRVLRSSMSSVGPRGDRSPDTSAAERAFLKAQEFPAPRRIPPKQRAIASPRYCPPWNGQRNPSASYIP